jgi:hypothetical protein
MICAEAVAARTQARAAPSSSRREVVFMRRNVRTNQAFSEAGVVV